MENSKGLFEEVSSCVSEELPSGIEVSSVHAEKAQWRWDIRWTGPSLSPRNSPSVCKLWKSDILWLFRGSIGVLIFIGSKNHRYFIFQKVTEGPSVSTFTIRYREHCGRGLGKNVRAGEWVGSVKGWPLDITTLLHLWTQRNCCLPTHDLHKVKRWRRALLMPYLSWGTNGSLWLSGRKSHCSLGGVKGRLPVSLWMTPHTYTFG